MVSGFLDLFLMAFIDELMAFIDELIAFIGQWMA